jgi:hypothetical protein
MVFGTFYSFIDFLNSVCFSILQCGAGTDTIGIASDVSAILFLDGSCCPLREVFIDGNSEREFFDFNDNNVSFMDIAVMVFIPKLRDPVSSSWFEVKTHSFQLAVPTFTIRAYIREFFSLNSEVLTDKGDQHH